MNINDSLKLQTKYFAPSSWWEHVPIAHWLVAELKPETIVELGTHYGVSFFSFCEAAEVYSPKTFVYAIDTWQGDIQAGLYGEDVFETVSSYRDEFHKQRSTLLRCTFDEASNKFGEQTIDIIHIDGLHTYDAVREDYETWKPKLREGGSLLLHDWNVREGNFGVWKLWDEIKNDCEFRCIETPNGYGLAIATLAKEKPEWHVRLEKDLEVLKRKGKLLSRVCELEERNKQLVSENNIANKHAENLLIIIKQTQEENQKLKTVVERHKSTGRLIKDWVKLIFKKCKSLL